jgi:hypothetical protein
MTEERGQYHAGPTDGAEPPLATEDRGALAHAHRQGIPYETSEQLLQRLPERLRDLSDVILGGRMDAQEIADALAALIDRIENATAEDR